jgi:hypothetical protein
MTKSIASKQMDIPCCDEAMIAVTVFPARIQRETAGERREKNNQNCEIL